MRRQEAKLLLAPQGLESALKEWQLKRQATVQRASQLAELWDLQGPWLAPPTSRAVEALPGMAGQLGARRLESVAEREEQSVQVQHFVLECAQALARTQAQVRAQVRGKAPALAHLQV